MKLDPRVEEDLIRWYQQLTAKGELLTRSQLDGYYETFRNRFGPSVLQGLDGEQLLDLMHNHSNRDSLVYWLEFKDDDEFPARFGGIGGGSALKFGIYRRKETGNWMTGSAKSQREIPTDEAVEIARKHRQQLLQGVRLLEQLPQNATDAEYEQLQNDMNRVAPDVGDSAWGHKYFSLLFSEKLDDYHSPDWQRFYLTSVLQMPPDADGRYIAAGRFVAIARKLGMPLNNLTAIMSRRMPRRSYWRVGTSDGTRPRNRWDIMRQGPCIAIGWPKLGSLSDVAPAGELNEKIKELMQRHYPKDPRALGKAARQVFRFVTTIQEGDLAIACDGATVLGIGRVVGEYRFDPSTDSSHQRPVEWLSLDEWKLPEHEGLRTTVHQLRRHPRNIVEIERRVLGAIPVRPPVGPGPKPKWPLARLPGLAGRIQAILERKGQVILFGPPGTGKTYWAQHTTRELAAQAMFGASIESLDSAKKQEILGDGIQSRGYVRMCCFHPAYGYEDFIEGYRPDVVDGRMVFSLKDGVFKRLCADAAEHSNRQYYLIIDEINRGDIPRIFGELLHALEMDKRNTPLTLPISGAVLRVPRNMFVIGTMNTADRSIALLDTALRRRFGFIELLPDSSTLAGTVVEGIPLGPWLDALNQRIREHVGRDGRNLQVGHAYLFDGGKPVATFPRLVRIVREDLIPLLQEYCYEDYSALENILGKSIVDGPNQAIRHQVFEDGQQEKLVQALLAPCPELATSQQATVADEEETVEDEDDDEGDDAA